MEQNNQALIEVRDLTLSYDDYVVVQDISFQVNKGDIFIIMGSSGSGKTTLLKTLIGLKEPAKGEIFYKGKGFWESEEERLTMMRSFGVLYQTGALWSSFTLGENIALPLELYSKLSKEQIRQMAEFKLALVGLAGYEDFYPAQISEGMNKRAGLARAIALDPEIIFFDEPAAGLDPVNAGMLDNLILQLRDTLEATIVIVTHELASIFRVGTNAIFIDMEKKTITAKGNPKELLNTSEDAKVIEFLSRKIK